jgi:hypothetical protein
MSASPLINAFATGRLLRPDYARPSTVDLVQAVALRCGDTSVALNANVATLADDIGTPDHLVFVVIDGMGCNLLARLPAGAFMPERVAREIQSVFPSTTAAAITTLAIGLWPAQHGVLGWWGYLAERGLSIVTLPFVERFSGRPLVDWGLTANDLWPFQPLLARLRHEPRAIHPASFCQSVFNLFARGGRDGAGYTSIASAVDQAIGRVVTAKAPTLTYLYLPELDTVCHRFGTDSPEVLALLTQLDAEMSRLAGAIAGRARLVISADHGHQNVSEADHLALCDGDPMLGMLVAPPSGEPRVPYFHVREGRRGDFVRLFEQSYGDRMALLSIDEADDLRLFGPMPLSATARRRIGDFMGLGVDPVTLIYYPPGMPSNKNHKSHHAGLAPNEVRVPVILA